MDIVKLRYLFSALLMTITAAAESAERYNARFLNGIDQNALRDFAASESDVLPGRYYVNVYINEKLVDSREITFSADAINGRLAPCISAEEYIRYGVKINDDSQRCYPLVDNLTQARLEVDIASHRLAITLPQQFVLTRPYDYVSPALFDDGINAAFINYNYTHDETHGDWGSDRYQYLSLNSGLNLGAWRLRNSAYWNKTSDQTDRWKSLSSTLETSIIAWRSRLEIGQTSTDASVFDSIQFRGAQLGSDSEMLPGSQTGYAPVIRGVANSNARVEVRQNKYVIFSENVPPGPFEISDISAVNRSGDFTVTVIEADGSHNTFTVAYTTLPKLVRSGMWNYQISAGRYHDGVDGYAPDFMQSTLSFGLNNAFTLYGGGLAAENYRAGAAGVGINMGNAGAVSADYTFASTLLADGRRRDGGSIRFLYAKSFLATSTDFQVAGYRYSTAGYYSFSDAVIERRRWHDGSYTNYRWPADDDPYRWQNDRPDTYYSTSLYNKKNRLDISASQKIGKHSSFYLNFSQQKYWNSASSDLSLQSGFSSSIGKINYGIYYQNSRNHYTQNDNSLNLRLSVPFNFADSNSITASMSLSHSKSAGTTEQAGLNGSLLDDGRLSYALSTAYDQATKSTNSASLGYQGQYGNVYAGYAYNNASRQVSANLAGGMVAHRGGITLSQPLGTTFSLVEARGAEGVGISNQTGVKINRYGYAVVPQTLPWRPNAVELNTQDFDEWLDVPNAVSSTVPTRGAIALVKFETYRGQSVLIHGSRANGDYPPPGALLYTADGRNNGLVGPGGEMFVSGVNPGDILRVKWGELPEESCTITLPAAGPDEPTPTAYRELTLVCADNLPRP
ncbi:membrane protein [Raoultella ornithinolytica]|uniref:fimbria/pilus outer membrane usher protein n=1 Tax=Raoultella ornithinolytica TaxID=54291 RepID=UPI0005981A7F|nr:membrane protein [Raoultella ornithinolytica]